jgi:hypothetical protein
VCPPLYCATKVGSFSQDAPTQLVSPHHPSPLHHPRPSPLYDNTTDASRLPWACCTVVAPNSVHLASCISLSSHTRIHPPSVRRVIKTHRTTVRLPRPTAARPTITRIYVRTLHPVQVTAEEGRTANSNSTLNPATTPRHHHLCHRCAPPRHHTRVRRASSCHCAPRQLCVCDCSAVRLFSTSIVFMALVVACTRLFTHLTLTITLQLTCISAMLAHSHLSHKLKRSPSHTRPYALLVARRPAST